MNTKYRNIIIVTILFSIFFVYHSKLTAQTYGLKFQGQDVTLDKRTELNLTPDNFLKFKDEFEISFDFKFDFRTRNSLFGYILRIINQENNNVDLLSTPDPIVKLNLVIGKENSIIPIVNSEKSMNNWINLRIKFLLAEDRLVFYIADSFYVHKEIGFKQQDAFKIIFGATDYKQFKTSDVPSINIKNVKLFEKGKLKYSWPLNLEEGNIAIDRIKKQKATIKNPVWLKLRHRDWQTKFEDEVKGNLLFASDIENGKIFIVGSNFLNIYSVDDNSIQKNTYKNKPLFFNSSYSAIYSSRDKKIYCYLAEGKPIYSLNIETGEWSETGTFSNYETKYMHHNSFYNATDNSIYLFGGYGQHKYNNLIRKIDLNKNTIHQLSTDDSVFYPRYLAGLGALNDTLYILGGYGSESGNQLINPHSYYDLFGYSIKNGSLFKKFEIPRIVDDMSVANSMWIDKTTRDYFALIFEKTQFYGYLQLIKGNLDSPGIEMVGDKIPFQFLDIRSFASLLYIPQKKEFLACTTYTTDSTTTQVKIHTISYPPSRLEEDSKAFQRKKENSFWYYAIAFILLAGAVIGIHLKRKQKLTGHSEIADEKDIPTLVDSSSNELMAEEPVYQLICFGGFQVFNKDFVDITSKFSPLLKELFLLILLHTFKNNKGISSDKITEILWYYKSAKSARNNLSVNIARIRSIMNEVGTFELTKKTGYWKIIPDEQSIKSDYIDFLNLTASKTNLTKEKINRLIKITQKGAFLMNVHYDWLDDFKATVSDTIIDTLVKFADSCDVNKDPDFIIHLSDSIFNFDLVNEDAMILKCKAQYCMGKHSHAQATYEKFFKEYKTMYDQEYDKSFLKILGIQ